jgi:hypothetical protein
MMCGNEDEDQDSDDKQLDLSGGARSLLGGAPPAAAPKETKTASGGGEGLGLFRSDGSLGNPGYGSMSWWTSNVASAEEMEAVSTVVGYQPREDMWKMCYNVDKDTKNSQTFHAQCDNVGTAFVSLCLSLAP